jgi:hypothetical protein
MSPTMGFTHHKTLGEHYHEFNICKDLLKISSVFGGNVQQFVGYCFEEQNFFFYEHFAF